jgi:hypothetical protein
MRLNAVDAVGAAPHQAMDGGDELHAVFQDAVEVFQRTAADDGQPAVQGARQIVEQRRAACVGPDLFGSRHDRGQGSVKIEKQRRAGGKATGGGGKSLDACRTTDPNAVMARRPSPMITGP